MTAHGKSAGTARTRPLPGEFLLVLGCFFLSGLAALLYQTVWMRQFAVVFGTSELAIATVLSAYMAGLALGSGLASYVLQETVETVQPGWKHWLQSWLRRPVLAYGVLEFGIALGALLVPIGMQLIQHGQHWVLGGQAILPDAGGLAQPLFYAGSAFLVLLLPTVCMGATLPLLSRSVVTQHEQIGRRVGLLYASNTLGAVLGTLLAAFVLLPQFGMLATTLCGVLANLLVFALAWKLDQNFNPMPQTATPRDSSLVILEDETFQSDWIPVIMLVSGMVSFTYEVLWSRLLGHVIGGSVYAFATMLAAFLTGITLGSVVASPLARSRTAAWWGLILAQLGTALTSLTIFSLLDSVPQWKSQWTASNDLVQSAWLCGCLLLPATVCIGATFPFAVRLSTRQPSEVGSVAGNIYAWNTIGGVLGAFAAGFWFVPILGFSGSLHVAVACNLLLALCTFLLRRLDWVKRGAAVALVLLGVLLIQPRQPDRLLSMSPLMNDGVHGDLVSLKVGRSSTVRLSDWQGFFLIQNNGLPEALIARRGAPPRGTEVHRWLTGLPLLARPQAKNLLVIGFGGGTAVEGIPDCVQHIDVIELEPEVIAANREIGQARSNDPLQDKRLHVVLNDARGALSLSNRKYDIIVSQPSHPWTGGASHLYTREFLQLAQSHLEPGGVLLQWMDSKFVDDKLFRSVGATMLAVFPHVRLYQPSETSLLFLASNEPLLPEREAVATNGLLARYPDYFSRLPVNGVNDLAAALLLETSGLQSLCEHAPVNTDRHNLLAFYSSAKKNDDQGAGVRTTARPVDPLFQPTSSLWTDPAIHPLLNPAVIATRLGATGQLERATAFANSQTAPGAQALLYGIVARGKGQRTLCQQAALQAITESPDLHEARFLLCESFLQEFLAGTAPPAIEQQRQLLRQPERTVFEAYLAMQQGDLLLAARHDARLAHVTPNQLAYVPALYCRAAWRASPVSGLDRLQNGLAALELVDRALVLSQRDFGYLIRCNAARLSAQPDEQLESIRSSAQSLQETLNESDPLHRDRVQVLQQAVTQLQTDPRFDPRLTRQVATEVQRLSQSVTPNPTAPAPILPVHFERPN